MPPISSARIADFVPLFADAAAEGPFRYFAITAFHYKSLSFCIAFSSFFAAAAIRLIYAFTLAAIATLFSAFALS